MKNSGSRLLYDLAYLVKTFSKNDAPRKAARLTKWREKCKDEDPNILRCLLFDVSKQPTCHLHHFWGGPLGQRTTNLKAVSTQRAPAPAAAPTIVHTKTFLTANHVL